ncbi:MAG: tetratricopeptide repeat protein [Candidatus Delongbacteria bacterium]|nr:tetratricopeptide repeat protein [Candidatus Delongbacteria bacterium]
MSRSILFLIGLLAFCGTTIVAGPAEDFHTGVTAYSEGDYLAAGNAFEAVLEQGLVSGELYYNLGNCAFRQENVALAILYWERARKLLPHDPDLLRNLDLAAGLLADPLPPDAQLPLWRWLDLLLDLLTPSGWGLLMLVISWLLAITLGWRLWRNTLLLRRLTPYLVSMLLIAGAFFGTRLYRDANDHRAVVMVQKVTVRSAPDSLAAELFDLHSGSQVLLREATREWRRIRLPNGQGGWLPQSSITTI